MVTGAVGRADRQFVEGWAIDPAAINRPVRLSIYCNDQKLGDIVADRYRKDLVQEGAATSHCGFSCALAGLLPAGLVTLRVLTSHDLQELPGSPVTLLPVDDAAPIDIGPGEGSLDGKIDLIDRSRIDGWARSRGASTAPVSLLVTVNGRLNARVLANAYRHDLAAAGHGNGRHAFSVRLSNISPFQPCTIRIQRELDGADLPGSPILLDAVSDFDERTQADIGVLLGSPSSDDDLKTRLDFLAAQMIRLSELRVSRSHATDGPGPQNLFRRRWQDNVTQTARTGPPRALVIDQHVPQQDRDAGSGAILSHLHCLAQMGFLVSFAPADMAGGPGIEALHDAGITCYHRPWCASVEELLRAESNGFDVVLIHRFQNHPAICRCSACICHAPG